MQLTPAIALVGILCATLPGNQATPAPQAQVKKDVASGKYVITYGDADHPREFIFEPATLVRPRIVTSISFDASTSRYVYRYTLANLADARQQLHSVSISAQFPTTITETPSGWEPNVVPVSSRFSWYMIPRGVGLEGVLPGAELEGFAVESEYIPGPSQARCRGNVEPPSLPRDLPEDVNARVDDLLRRDFIVVPVLAPRIPAGSNEPEMTPAVFLSRIRASYASELRRNYPHGDRVDDALAELVARLESGDATAYTRIGKVRADLASARVRGWPQTLGAGLITALDHFDRKFKQHATPK